MKKVYSAGLAALALAVILGVGLQDSFARGHGGFRDIPLDSAQAKELRQMHRNMEDKYFEMMDLFAEKSVDAGKAKALQKDIQDIRNKIGAFWLDAALAYKQANPEWQPRFGGMGGHGYGQRHGWDGGGPGPRMMDNAPGDE